MGVAASRRCVRSSARDVCRSGRSVRISGPGPEAPASETTSSKLVASGPVRPEREPRVFRSDARAITPAQPRATGAASGPVCTGVSGPLLQDPRLRKRPVPSASGRCQPRPPAGNEYGPSSTSADRPPCHLSAPTDSGGMPPSDAGPYRLSFGTADQLRGPREKREAGDTVAAESREPGGVAAVVDRCRELGAGDAGASGPAVASALGTCASTPACMRAYSELAVGTECERERRAAACTA